MVAGRQRGEGLVSLATDATDKAAAAAPFSRSGGDRCAAVMNWATRKAPKDAATKAHARAKAGIAAAKARAKRKQAGKEA